MIWRRREARLLSVVTLAIALGGTSLSTGCRTSTKDVNRWGKTKQGPNKLVAVLTHDKYDDELRVEAARTMINMKPRAGKRLGISNPAPRPHGEAPGLIEALEGLDQETRKRLVMSLLPKLQEKMKEPPPVAQGGEGAPPDASFNPKDAAFAILTHEKDLVEDDTLRASVKASLRAWVMADFANRLDNTSQMFGVEKVLRYLGKEGVKEMPKLMLPDARRIREIAALVAELGDDATKDAASKALVTIAKEIDSDLWKKKKAPDIDAANKASGFTKINKDQFDAQLNAYQEEELLRVFSSMKKVGRRPIVEYLLEYAMRADESPDKALGKRQVTALAALGGNLDKENKSDVERVLKLASAENTSDAIRSVALQRVGEMPRSLVADRLFGLFKHEKWQIRWVSAELILKMSKASQLAEFMTKLGKNHDGMSLSEPFIYGLRIGEMKGDPKVETLIDKYLGRGNSSGVRLTALSYYAQHGTKAQLAKVTGYEGDGMKVPACKEDADGCQWLCVVGEGKKAEQKEIATVGEFVKYCVKPSMEKRTATKKKKEKGKK